MFDNISKPKTLSEHENIQKSYIKNEEEEHQMIEIRKGIEVMDAHRDENEFILSALQERCQDYKDTLVALEDSIKTLSEINVKDHNHSNYQSTIEKTE